jgi:hypothetical protein
VIIDLPLVTVCGHCLLADVEHDAARILRRLGPVHMAAGGKHLALIFLEIEVEMGQHMVLDVAGIVPERIEFRQRVGSLLALADEAFLHIAERFLQLHVDQRLGGVGLELVGGEFHQLSPRPPICR